MTETDRIKKRRDVRIVGYEKRLLVAQMQILAAVLLLPAMAISHGWGAGLLCVLFFGLILAVFVQVWKLRATGLLVTIEEVESDEATEEPAAEVPAVEEKAEELPPPTEPAKDHPHWSDQAYPDPDVELGLIEESIVQANSQKPKNSHSDSDE